MLRLKIANRSVVALAVFIQSEFHHDEVSQELKYITNGTHALPSGGTVFEATRHRCLFNLSGSPQAPVQGVTLQGLVIKDTKESFLNDHGTPTGGDWYDTQIE